MTPWGVLTLVCVAFIFVEARRFHQKRETKSHLCDPVFNNTNKIQCYCEKGALDNIIKKADCSLVVEGVTQDDPNWKDFEELKDIGKLDFTNSRGSTLKYIPQKALEYTKAILKLSIKYGNIEVIEPFAFANLTLVREISLADNQIKTLKGNAFSHHRDLRIIGLDTNAIVEINRDVFIDLPSLEKIYLTNNKITTIHDRAFVHLTNLKEIEIDRNNLFSLNNETFSGLKNLEKLDLSGNSLEVIGDNTFLPLKNLCSLNLEGNKIQMLDEKAFKGITHLSYLSLSHNVIKDIDNVKIFEGLNSLVILNLKGNQLQTLKEEVMAPILSNFYSNISSLDIEDNIFPCDCRLDWFLILLNKTLSPALKLTIDNLKCIPSAELREKWNKATESDKNEETANADAANDYEYYDDTTLNGKLFYTDLRFLLNCSNEFDKPGLSNSPVVTTIKPQSPKIDVTTHKATEAVVTSTEFNKVQEITEAKKIFTTNRLVTVSENPIERLLDQEMASDEAKPDKIKAHRSVQDINDARANNAYRNLVSVMFIVPFIIIMYL